MKKKTVGIIIFLFLTLSIRFYFMNYKYEDNYYAFVYRNGNWDEMKLNLNINYNHNFIMADNIVGSIYINNGVLKYWKDYLIVGESEKILNWNKKELIYRPKNSYIDGKYVQSGFSKEEFVNLGNIYYKDFMKSIVIILREHEFYRKDGINYFETGEYKPIIIITGKVDINDLKKLQVKDYLLRELDINKVPPININKNIKIPYLKFSEFKFKKSIENVYKEFAWKALGSFVDYEDIKKIYGEPKRHDYNDYIVKKIAELENFKSGFIDNVEINNKVAYTHNNRILTEGMHKMDGEQFYSAILYRRNNNYNGYIVENIYTIKIFDDGTREFISDEFGILSYD